VHSSQRLKELQTLVQKIDIAVLGNDWESRKLLKEVRRKAIEEIKCLRAGTKTTGMVK
jgi:hypothetical protein